MFIDYKVAIPTIRAFKMVVLLFSLAQYSVIMAQGAVGIGTATPRAALDVVSTTQGILPPRMTGAQVSALTVGSNQNSMLVYATSISGSINKIGYWYYDHTTTSWKPFDADITANNGLSMASGNVTLGGALTQATTISNLTATNKMSFVGTGIDAFNVDGTTFSIDATNNRVGIGTSNPLAPFQIGSSDIGNVQVKYGTATNTGYIEFYNGGNTSTRSAYIGYGSSATTGTNGNGININTANGHILLEPSGNVGIGIATPSQKLDINGKIRVRTTDPAPLPLTDMLVTIDANGDVKRASINGITRLINSINACNTALATASNLTAGGPAHTLKNFTGMSGRVYVDIQMYAACYGTNARFKGFVDLDTNSIFVDEYNHFDGLVYIASQLTGHGTNTVLGFTSYGQFRLNINSKILTISNAYSPCNSIMNITGGCHSSSF